MTGLDNTDRVDWGLIPSRQAKDPIQFIWIKPLYLTMQPYADLTRRFSVICNPRKRLFILAPFLKKLVRTHVPRVIVATPLSAIAIRWPETAITNY